MKPIFFGLACSVWAWAWDPTAAEKAAIAKISAASMRGHLSFLASDLLEGRSTPSRGQDLAAEYIAAQFRRAGLEPAGPNGSYFQEADFVSVTPKMDDFRLTWNGATFGPADAYVAVSGAVDLGLTPVVRLPADNVEGKIVIGQMMAYSRGPAVAALRAQKPAMIVLVNKTRFRGFPTSQLRAGDAGDDVPTVILFGDKAVELLESKDAALIAAHISAPEKKPVKLRNVAAILRGSDAQLKEEYVVLSAHYDHLPPRPEGTEGDRIFNGANDNGSGTVSVIEIASALATADVHPKRSLLFVTFFGEEIGLLGANYYTKHPLVPLKNTVANINLEQMGRTDEQDGKQVGKFAFTGPTYSNIPGMMEEAAMTEGVGVYEKKGADAFFGRSDNYAFAQAGIVDHTVVVAFEYPDYHAVGDEWEKLDYDNMAKVDRGVAAGLVRLADETAAPKWSNVPEANKYRK